jgi:hypothetical protein
MSYVSSKRNRFVQALLPFRLLLSARLLMCSLKHVACNMTMNISYMLYD